MSKYPYVCLMEIAKMPEVYNSEINLAIENGVPVDQIQKLIEGLSELTKLLDRMETEAYQIWKKYAI